MSQELLSCRFWGLNLVLNLAFTSLPQITVYASISGLLGPDIVASLMHARCDSWHISIHPVSLLLRTQWYRGICWSFSQKGRKTPRTSHQIITGYTHTITLLLTPKGNFESLIKLTMHAFKVWEETRENSEHENDQVLSSPVQKV